MIVWFSFNLNKNMINLIVTFVFGIEKFDGK
jgi:hypothetical protein